MIINQEELQKEHELLIYEIKQIFETHNEQVKLVRVELNQYSETIFTLVFKNIYDLADSNLQDISNTCKELKLNLASFHLMTKYNTLILTFYKEPSRYGNSLFH